MSELFPQNAIRQDDVLKQFLYHKCCTASHGGETNDEMGK